MGSEKYPEESDFDAFLKIHGGGSNAYTDCERVNFEILATKLLFRIKYSEPI